MKRVPGHRSPRPPCPAARALGHAADLTSAKLDQLLEHTWARSTPRSSRRSSPATSSSSGGCTSIWPGRHPLPNRLSLRQRPDQGQAGQAGRRPAREPRVRPQLGAVLARRDPVPRHQPDDPAVRYDALEDWLAEQFQKNRPWDEIATAHDHGHGPGRRERRGQLPTGPRGQARGAGRRGLADLPRRPDPVRPVPRSQDRSWKREQFHEFAAFFSGTRAKPVVRGMPGQFPVFEVEAQGRPRYTMPDKDDPTKQMPIAPRFFLASSKSDATAREPGRRRAAGARRLVHHRAGQPLVRPRLRQPDLVRPDGRVVLRRDRRPGTRANAQGPGGDRDPGRAVAEGGL